MDITKGGLNASGHSLPVNPGRGYLVVGATYNELRKVSLH